MENDTNSSWCRFGRKQIGILIGIVLIVLGLASYIVANRNHAARPPLSNSRYGFQFLKPTQLPHGFKITASRVNVNTEGNVIYGISAEMDLRTVDWVYEIQESRYGAYTGNEDNIHTLLSNFSPTSIKPTCAQEITPHNRTYRLCHWIDYGRISVYEVESVQDGVFIHTTFPATKQQNIPVSVLSSYVDSFTPANPPKSVVSGI